MHTLVPKLLTVLGKDGRNRGSRGIISQVDHIGRQSRESLGGKMLSVNFERLPSHKFICTTLRVPLEI
jgi:hypothetical protein